MTLKLITDLIRAFDEENIAYCHWKSNTAWDETLSGINDLDILVAKDNKKKFISILKQLYFIRALSPNEAWFPDICHYYGYDKNDGKLVHIHLHYSLILGYDLIKNYHIPIENAYLQSAAECCGLKTPSCELDIIVFVIRMVLKRRFLTLLLGHPRHWLNALIGKGRGGLSKADQLDLERLLNESNKANIEKWRKKYFPFINVGLFNYCLDSISCDPKPYSWLVAGLRLSRVLKPYQRHNTVKTTLLITKRSVMMKLNSILCRLSLKKPQKKRPVYGGKIIAFVGGDGAGKTTNIEEANNWFGKYFNVRTIHIGHPPRSMLLFLISVFSKIWKTITGGKGSNFSRALILWCVGRDRYRCFHKARTLRGKGFIVLLDRIPLPGITAMDTPRVRILTGGKGIYSWLANREEYYHARIKGVDEIVVLKLDPQIALQRRPEDNPQELLERSGQIWNKKWSTDYAYIVDASLPLEEVKQIIRRRVWQVISQKPKIVEILGVADSGTSTVAGLLLKKVPYVHTRFPVEEYRWAYLKNFIKTLPVFIYFALDSKNRVSGIHLRSVVNISTTLDVLQRQKNKGLLNFKVLAFDQGPIFQLCAIRLMQMEKSNIMSSWLTAIEKQVVKVFDGVVLLDTDNNILKSRINKRRQGHRIKHNSGDDIESFLEQYRTIFQKVVANKDNNMLTIHRIDTGTLSADEVAAEIIKIVNTSDKYV